jgi:predicted DNA binding CopG/RHH family protein
MGIEDNFELLRPEPNAQKLMSEIRKAAVAHMKRKKAITIRIHEIDLESMKIKASKLGVPYQTYINMLIRRDAERSV